MPIWKWNMTNMSILKQRLLRYRPMCINCSAGLSFRPSGLAYWIQAILKRFHRLKGIGRHSINSDPALIVDITLIRHHFKRQNLAEYIGMGASSPTGLNASVLTVWHTSYNYLQRIHTSEAQTTVTVVNEWLVNIRNNVNLMRSVGNFRRHQTTCFIHWYGSAQGEADGLKSNSDHCCTHSFAYCVEYMLCSLYVYIYLYIPTSLHDADIVMNCSYSQRMCIMDQRSTIKCARCWGTRVNVRQIYLCLDLPTLARAWHRQGKTQHCLSGSVCSDCVRFAAAVNVQPTCAMSDQWSTFNVQGCNVLVLNSGRRLSSALRLHGLWPLLSFSDIARRSKRTPKIMRSISAVHFSADTAIKWLYFNRRI